MNFFLEHLLFRPASRRSLIAARVIVAGYALWLVLSRPMLWAISEWPREMFPLQHRLFLWRFGMLLVPSSAEHALYRLLPLLLVAAMFGIQTRIAALAASILLYHFGPMEEAISGLYSNGNAGFLFPTLGLIVVAFADYNDGADSPEYRWPVMLLQTMVVLQHLLSGLSKIRFTGITWYSGPNISATLQEMGTLTGAPWADRAASSLTISWAIAMATLGLEILFPLALVSRRARWILVPADLAGAFLRAQLYGFYTLGVPLLLLFVNWDYVGSRFWPAAAAPLPNGRLT